MGDLADYIGQPNLIRPYMGGGFTSGSSEVAARQLIVLLGSRSIHAYIYKVANTGSVYVHFGNAKLGKLRVGDHEEKINLGYRWQLRLDIAEYSVNRDKGHNQFYYPMAMMDKMVNHIENYNKKILESK